MIKLVTLLVLLNIATLGVCKGVLWWCTYKDKFLNTYTSGNSTYRDWDTAESQCLQRFDCFGVTKKNRGPYTLRKDWKLKKSYSGEYSFVPCVGYFSCNKIGLKCASGKFLSVQPDGTVQCNSDSYGLNEEVTFQQWGKSSGYLKSRYGKYLSATNKDKLEWNREDRKSWEKFTLTQEQDKLSFMSTHGKYISGRPDGSVHVDNTTRGTMEWFTVHPQACLVDVECDCPSEINRDDYELGELVYHTSRGTATTFRPERIGYQYINNKDSSVKQSTTFSVSETVTETSTFTHTAGVEVMVGTEFTSGVPTLAQGKITVEVTASYEFSAGIERSVEKTMQADYKCKAPAGKIVTCEALLFKHRYENIRLVVWVQYLFAKLDLEIASTNLYKPWYRDQTCEWVQTTSANLYAQDHMLTY